MKSIHHQYDKHRGEVQRGSPVYTMHVSAKWFRRNVIFENIRRVFPGASSRATLTAPVKFTPLRIMAVSIKICRRRSAPAARH
ncbi:hypothetical protein KCP69_25365 [Salmonella enterica subsp. enterica]|nr:hypothetical protein KCP69_25365 [Salmonella enterica subsp. enterica]